MFVEKLQNIQSREKALLRYLFICWTEFIVTLSVMDRACLKAFGWCVWEEAALLQRTILCEIPEAFLCTIDVFMANHELTKYGHIESCLK